MIKSNNVWKDFRKNLSAEYASFVKWIKDIKNSIHAKRDVRSVDRNEKRLAAQTKKLEGRKRRKESWNEFKQKTREKYDNLRKDFKEWLNEKPSPTTYSRHSQLSRVLLPLVVIGVVCFLSYELILSAIYKITGHTVSLHYGLILVMVVLYILLRQYKRLKFMKAIIILICLVVIVILIKNNWDRIVTKYKEVPRSSISIQPQSPIISTVRINSIKDNEVNYFTTGETGSCWVNQYNHMFTISTDSDMTVVFTFQKVNNPNMGWKVEYRIKDGHQSSRYVSTSGWDFEKGEGPTYGEYTFTVSTDVKFTITTD